MPEFGLKAGESCQKNEPRFTVAHHSDDKLESNWLSGVFLFLLPVSQVDVLFDFPPLVAVFVWFIRAVSNLPEWMFGIADDFRDHLHGFRHTEDPS